MTHLLRQRTPIFGFLQNLFRDLIVIPLVVLMIVGVTLSWVAYQEYQQAQRSEYRLLEAHARNADIQVGSALSKIDHLLREMAEEQLTNHARNEQAFTALFDQYRPDIPEIGTLLVSDATGRIRAASDAKIVGRSVSQETYFSTHRAQGQIPKLFISRPDKRLLGVTTVTITRPIVDAHSQFLGIVGVTIGFRFFQRVLKDINSDDSASMAVIFNRDGDLLFRRSEPEQFFGLNISKISVIFTKHSALGLPVTRHIGPSHQDGKTRLFLVQDIGETGLSLILSRQFDEVLAIWRRNVIVYVSIFFFTAVVVTSLAVVAAHRKRQILAGKAYSDQLIATANVIVVGLDGTGHLTIFNETAERISGYGRDEVLGKNWFALALPPKKSEGIMDMFSLFRKNGTLPHTCEYPILTKAGQEHIISWQNSVVEEPRAAIFFGIDVTERKQMEADLVAAKQRAEDSNTAKSKFLAAISHDVRQPLHAQDLFLDVLAHTQLNTHQRSVLNSASAASKSCGEMLNTLLDFSRVDAGIMEPRVQSFRLQPLLNKIEREFESQADAKGIAYRSRETDLVALSDPMLVELILRNLVANAIRYTKHGGLLVACRQRGRKAVLEVWDTGIGIAPGNQQAVFREFFQLDNPERDQQKGLGLGLAIADGLARTLNHRLSLVSTPGRGSVFRLSIPIVNERLGEDQTQ